MSTDIMLEGSDGNKMSVTARTQGPVEFTIFEPRNDGSDQPMASWWVTAPNKQDRYTLFEAARVAAEHANAGLETDIDVPEWDEGKVEDVRYSALVGRDENGEEYLHTLNLFGRDDGTLQLVLTDDGIVFLLLEDPVDPADPDGRFEMADAETYEKFTGILKNRLEAFRGRQWEPGDEDEEG